MIDVRKLAEARKAELEGRQKAAMMRWKPYLDIVEDYFKGQGKELYEYQKANIAQCCDNLFDFFVLNKMNGMISEATTSDAIAFARQMLPTIPALLPSLVADHVSIVQAIDRPQAQVFYMNIKNSTNKGSLTAAGSLIDARTGHAASADALAYASDSVKAETIQTNPSNTYTSPMTLIPTMYFPLIPGSITVVATSVISGVTALETFTDNYTAGTVPPELVGTFTLTGSRGSTGTYNIATGVIVLTVNVTGGTAFAAPLPVVSYRYSVEKISPSAVGYGNQVPGLDIEVVSSNVDAQVFPLRLNYTVFSAINLQKIHGLVLADEGMKFATQEIRFAIDQVVLANSLAAATSTNGATSPGNFDATVASGQEWIWRMHEFKRYISKGSVNIFAKTLRATGNVIVAGLNVASLIELLPEFKPAAGLGTKPPAGPYVMGTLGTRLVIANPFYNANIYVLLFRGDNYLFAGQIYAPYVPLYATDPVTLADLTTQRGFMSQAAIKTINAGMFTYGTISSY